MPITQNPQAIFPDLPREAPTVDKDGQFSPLWALGLASLFQALQKNFKNTGILFPSLTSTQAAITTTQYTPYIGAPLPPGVEDISGQTIYNSTIEAPQIFIISYDGATPPNVTAVKWWTFTIT
jgi:hypothetical protein